MSLLGLNWQLCYSFHKPIITESVVRPKLVQLTLPASSTSAPGSLSQQTPTSWLRRLESMSKKLNCLLLFYSFKMFWHLYCITTSAAAPEHGTEPPADVEACSTQAQQTGCFAVIKSVMIIAPISKIVLNIHVYEQIQFWYSICIFGLVVRGFLMQLCTIIHNTIMVYIEKLNQKQVWSLIPDVEHLLVKDGKRWLFSSTLVSPPIILLYDLLISFGFVCLFLLLVSEWLSVDQYQ